MPEFQKFKEMHSLGQPAKKAVLEGKRDGLNTIDLIRMLREVFGCSLIEAKELTILSESHVGSLEEHQENLLPGIKKAFDLISKDTTIK